MAATLSSSGTFTALTMPTSSTVQGAMGNVPNLQQAPTSDFSTIPTEVTQVVQLFAVGYGINFWPAAVLLRSWLTGLINKGAPTTT